jgi:hypothetical protein
MARTEPQLPAWVQPISRLIIALQRAGIAFFSFHVLTIPGRRTGRMHSTVVSPFTVDGQRYVLSFGALNWVRNAQAAGWGLLSRGRAQTKVALVEVRPPGSRPILAEFPRQIPAGVQFFTRLGLVEAPGGPEQFEAAADRVTLFSIGPFDRTQ